MDGARPVYRGLGRGAPRGIPCGAPPFFFLHIVQPRALRGPFPCRGGLRSSAVSPGRLFAGRAEPPISAAGAGRRLPRGAPPFPRGRSRRHPARASLPAPGRAGRTGPRGASCGHREGPAVQLPGAGPASMSPSRLKRNRRVIPRAPAPLREWACGPSRHRSFERSSTWCLACGLHAFSGARRGHGALPTIQICVRNVETDIPGPEGPALWHH